MTSGVYGLECPDTGRVRYVGASRNVEAKFRQISERPWAPGVATGWEGNRVKQWLVALYREGKAPRMTVLDETGEDQFDHVKAAWVAALQKTGEADINGGGG